MIQLELWKNHKTRSINLTFWDAAHGDDVHIEIEPNGIVEVDGLISNENPWKEQVFDKLYYFLNMLLAREANKNSE
jgi:hypothetical protein